MRKAWISNDHFSVDSSYNGLDMTFPYLDTNHTASYRCALQLDAISNSALFNLTVKDPMVPEIKDGKDRDSIEDKWLDKNGQVILQCEVEGFPTSTITWFQHDELGMTDLLTKSDSL